LLLVLGAWAWMAASVGMTEKSVEVWQELHWAVAANGIWLPGLSWVVNAEVL
jgi:hypothetical protein